MKRTWIELTAATVLALAHVDASAGAYCAVESPRFDGIGDGCSTSGLEYVLPDIGIFRSTFTPACNAHDRCYTSVGGNYGLCNGRFLSDMRDACSSAFNKWLRPLEYYACRDTAERYYLAVEGWRSAKDPLGRGGMQADALRRSRNLESSVGTGLCSTTLEAAGLYRPEVIGEIHSRFLASTGRSPTIVESLRAANVAATADGWPLASHDFNAWAQTVQLMANEAVSALAPSMVFSVSGSTFAVSNPSPNVAYRWRIFSSDGSGGYTYYGSSSYTYPLPTSDSWSYFITVSGILEAHDRVSGRLIDSRPVSQRLLVPGPCGRYSSKMASVTDCDF